MIDKEKYLQQIDALILEMRTELVEMESFRSQLANAKNPLVIDIMNFKSLKEACDKAENENQTTFDFESHTIPTCEARRMINDIEASVLHNTHPTGPMN